MVLKMSMPVLTIVLLQTLLAACAIVMCVWAKLPWITIAALALLGASAVATQGVLPFSKRLCRAGLAMAWLCTLLVPASLVFITDDRFSLDTYLDKYFATLAWLIAAAMLPATSRLAEKESMERWKLPVMAWAFGGAILWIATAYWRNQTGAFYIGLLISVALLVFCHVWFRLSMVGIQVVNTLLLVLVGLPLGDVVFHPSYRLGKEPDLRRKLYSYNAGSKDPADFAHWWTYFVQQWNLTEQNLLIPGGGAVPFRLRPGSETVLMQSRIRINSRGFRGKEIIEPKGEVFRIVALGESTTFGITLSAEDRPWPERLEELIRERLKPNRPVEVINAGVAGYTLGHNLSRFARDILPLKPDLILCYHGINGFPSLDATLLPMLGGAPPRYKHRPLRLLADCEYRLKLMAYERGRQTRQTDVPVAASDPMDGGYAREYRELIATARTNGIHLALATFSMAVNERSEPGAIRFYEGGYRLVPRLIKANDLHSSIVRRLCEQHPEVDFIDTRPSLDGHPPYFIDLVHFSEEGRVKMAETFFAGLEELLKKELAPAQEGGDQS
ncbi:MAG TPA: SGNH/GDSL hydrolase family protein [Clostridia bacterium]|nr:SGNH/GDSL hydrolase family protein [Clostridia bacterium]